MDNRSLAGCAMVLRNEMVQAYEEGHSALGLELSYKASCLEILLSQREGRVQHYPHRPEAKPEGENLKRRAPSRGRVRQYTLHTRPRSYVKTYRQSEEQQREANPRQLNKLVMCLIQDCNQPKCPVCKSQPPPTPRKPLPMFKLTAE